MEQLSKIAQGLFIGNGEVWNFLDHAVNRNINSIISYTQNKNFLKNNLFNNFNGGDKRNYNYGDIKPTGNYGLLKSSDGILLTTNANAKGGDIGETYSVEYGKNSNLKTITKDDFTNIQNNIRTLLLNKWRKKNSYIKNTFPELYIYDLNDDEVKKYIPTTTLDIDNLFKEDGINTNSLRDSLIGDKLNKSEGLKKYYTGFREKYLEREKKHPSTSWRHNNSYGVDLKNVGEQHFSLNKDREDINTDISPEFKAGGSITYTPESGTVSYTYFQEPDGQNNNPNRFEEVSAYGWNSVSLSDYSSSSRLLKKTNELFKSHKIGSLINRFHGDTTVLNSDVISSYDSNFGLSRGRNLIKKKYEGQNSGDKSTGYDNPYCRVWTAHHQYSKLKDRIRPFVNENGELSSIAETQSNYGELRPNNGSNRLSEHSVLNNDGYLRITPTYDETGDYINNYQKYMFSIENLAWKDIGTGVLTNEQRGPNKGRIMWFPPYNLKFSENVNVNWNANSFIGRGEEIYTYTNTIRSGTLDFTLLIDHPSVLNKFRGTNGEVNNKEEVERDILRYFAGCGNLNDEIEPYKEDKEKNKPDGNPKTTPVCKKKTYKVGYVVFFPNNFSGIDLDDDKMQGVLLGYNTSGEIKVSIVDKKYENQNIKPQNYDSEGIIPLNYIEDIKKMIFNNSVDDIKFIDGIVNLPYDMGAYSGDTIPETSKIYGFETDTCKVSSITFKGFASSHGRDYLNSELCNRRRHIMEKLIGMNCDSLKESEKIIYNRLDSCIIDVDKTEDINDLSVKLSRAAYAIVEVEWKDENIAQSDVLVNGSTSVEGLDLSGGKTKSIETPTNQHTHTREVANNDDYSYDNEYLYFSSLRGDSLEYKSIVDKVRYFEPSFHSITPEGFNARLTFLHQCTRQGPTNAVSSGNINRDSNDYLKFAGNLAFGRAPYCILRIGDFFNTKICIDSLSVTYDNNGVQWDLNPEGVGVQPMYANISMSFKFIGGQDISGPIERLQNAVTANYYANASVYSRHADNETSYYDAVRNKDINKN